MGPEIGSTVNIFDRVPLLLDNCANFEDPLILPNSRDSDRFIDRDDSKKNFGHVMYFIDRSNDSFNLGDADNLYHISKNRTFNQNSNMSSEIKIDSIYLSEHTKIPLHSGVFNTSITQDSFSHRCIHWRILNNGSTLELRVVNFLHVKHSVDQNLTSISFEKMNDSDYNDISSITSFVFPEALDGEIRFFDDFPKGTSPITDSLTHPDPMIIWALTVSGTIFRITLPSVSLIGFKNVCEHVVIEKYKIKTKSTVEKHSPEYISQKNNNSIFSDSNSSKNFNIYRKQIQCFDSKSVMVHWVDGLVVIISGFSSIISDNSSRISELMFYLIEDTQKSFINRLYKKFDPLPKNNLEAVLLHKLSYNNIHNAQTELVIGIESNKTLWIWKPLLGISKIQIKLPIYESDSHSHNFNSHKFLIRILDDYPSPPSTPSTKKSKEGIAMVVFIPGVDGGYFAIIEGLVDNENFDESILKVSSVKKTNEIFSFQTDAIELVDFQVLLSSSCSKSKYLSWKIFSIWRDSGVDKVMYGYLETSNPNQKNIDCSDPQEHNTIISWGIKSSIGEMWIAEYPVHESQQPLTLNGELELLQEWLVDKKNDPNSQSFYGIDQSVDLELGSNLIEKISKKIQNSFLGYILNPMRFSISVVKSTLKLYIQKTENTPKESRISFSGKPLRQILIDIIGKKLSQISDVSKSCQSSEVEVYVYANSLYVEWMWFLSTCVQIQNDHNAINSLFINKTLSVVGVSKSLSVEIFQYGGDLEWIIENSKSQSNYSLTGNNMGINEDPSLFGSNTPYLPSLITITPLKFLNPVLYPIVKSENKINLLILSQAIRTIGSKLNSSFKAQLIYEFELRFVGGIYLDIEGELSNLFHSFYSSNQEDIHQGLKDMIDIIYPLNSFFDAMKILTNLIMEFQQPVLPNVTYLDPLIKNASFPTQTFAKIPTSLLSSKISLIINKKYSLICDILIFLSSVSFLINHSTFNDLKINGTSKASLQLKSEFTKKLHLFTQKINQEGKNLLFSQTVEAFRIYTFLVNYSKHSTSKCSIPEKSYLVEMSRNLNKSYQIGDEVKPHSIHVDNNSLSSYSKTEPNSFSSEGWIKIQNEDIFSEVLFHSIFHDSVSIYNIFTLDSENSIETLNGVSHEKHINHNKSQNAISFEKSISNLVLMCIDEYISYEQVLLLIKYLPAVFQVSFLSGVVNAEIGRQPENYI
ncbi:hypothetical protein AYI68_g3927 [Smittium mucronatum]|uniref:Nucleoporin Nup120/160 beta-propeller domain-containing protein n=1 Tax=Smittium mucronatum TaxID=133383 RepID=A0A1R0GYH6_9FUNG|nr:hypothetical protein AYI68_g3927 [Smittium mucronatum]